MRSFSLLLIFKNNTRSEVAINSTNLFTYLKHLRCELSAHNHEKFAENILIFWTRQTNAISSLGCDFVNDSNRIYYSECTDFSL